MSEIGEEAAPAAVPATASPLKPIVVKLTSKPAAQEEQVVSADPDEDPLSTKGPNESEDNIDSYLVIPTEDTKSADGETKSADEESKAADEETKVADEEVKTADEEAKTADEEAKAVDGEAKSADEEAMSAEEAKSADEEAKAADEETKAVDETTKTADEDTKAADETSMTTEDPVKLTDSTAEADATKVEEEVKAAEEPEMETTEVSEKPALVLNPIATAAAKNVESDPMETEEKLFYESVKDLETETAEEPATKPADEAVTKPVEEPVKELADNPTVEKDVEMQDEVVAEGVDMDELDYDEDVVEDMIEINTDDISFDEPPKPTTFKSKPITAPVADGTPGTIITGNGITGTTSTTATDAKEVTATIIQFNDENVLFEFSADGCRGLIGVVKTKNLKIPGKVFVSGSTKDMIKFIKVCTDVLKNILL